MPRLSIVFLGTVFAAALGLTQFQTQVSATNSSATDFSVQGGTHSDTHPSRNRTN